MAEVIPLSWLGERKTIEEIERWSVGNIKQAIAAGAIPASTPRVPFGYEHERWQEFISTLVPGDIVYEVATPEEYFEKGMGQVGYAAYRGGQLEATMMSKGGIWDVSSGLAN